MTNTCTLSRHWQPLRISSCSLAKSRPVAARSFCGPRLQAMVPNSWWRRPQWEHSATDVWPHLYRVTLFAVWAVPFIPLYGKVKMKQPFTTENRFSPFRKVTSLTHNATYHHIQCHQQHNLTVVTCIQGSFGGKGVGLIRKKGLSWLAQDTELLGADMASGQTLCAIHTECGPCSSVKQVARGGWICAPHRKEGDSNT